MSLGSGPCSKRMAHALLFTIQLEQNSFPAPFSFVKIENQTNLANLCVSFVRKIHTHTPIIQDQNDQKLRANFVGNRVVKKQYSMDI